MSRNLDPSYFETVQKKLGIPHENIHEFWDLPYAKAVEIAQQIAKGSDIAARYGLVSDFPLFAENAPPNKQSDEFEIRTRKILRQLIFQKTTIFHFGAIGREELDSHVSFVGLENFEKAVQTGRPVVLLNSHVGPGQLAPLFLARFGYKMCYLGARNFPKLLGLDGYESINFIPSGENHTQIVARGIEALRDGQILNTTGDGFTGSSGKRRPFLGKQRPVREGYAYMMAITKALAVPVFTQLDSSGKLTVTFHDALEDLSDAAPKAAQIDHTVDQYLALLERYWVEDFGNVNFQLGRRHARMKDVPVATSERV